MQNRHLFHSFPRAAVSETRDQTIDRGLSILRYMFEIGLILAPELVTWGRGDGEPTTLLQTRICFTELARSELPEHSKTFGPFALQFSPKMLRSAGAMPVIYAPQAIEGHPASGLAEFCVKAATSTKYVLEQLEQLKKIALQIESGTFEGKKVDPGATINLKNADPAGNIVHSSEIKGTDIANLMHYLGFRNIPFDHSIGMLDVYENIFYPTDNVHIDDALGYYRQREWRLAGTIIAMNDHFLSRPLTPVEQERLEAIDFGFWTHELTMKGVRCKRSGLARIYTPQTDWSLEDLVDTILVPASAEAAVRKFYDGRVEVL